MDYSEGSLFTILIVALITGSKYTLSKVTHSLADPTQDIKGAPVPFFLKPITNGIASKIDASFVDPELKTHFDFLEDYLSKSPNNGKFFCGSSITGADVMIHFGLEAATQRVPLSESSYPKLYEYMRRLQGRDAYKRAAERVTKASGEEFVPFSDAKL